MDEAERLFQQGRMAYGRNDLEGAERTLRAAYGAAPHNRLITSALGGVLAKQKKLVEGYPLLRLRDEAPNLPIPRWAGEPVARKRVLIWAEEGLGDQIMLARYARRMVDVGAEVCWLCPPELARLLRSMGIVPLPSTESATISGFDYYCPSGALLAGAGYEIGSAPYVPMPEPAAAGQIGVMTFAGANHLSGPERTLPPDQASQLLALPGATDLDPRKTKARDLFDTAQIIAGLDLVITVDTAVAHLAGAMGKQTWILLPFVADWRWFTGDESPWYGSVKLVRAPAAGTWAVDQVIQECSR